MHPYEFSQIIQFYSIYIYIIFITSIYHVFGNFSAECYPIFKNYGLIERSACFCFAVDGK